ncbi:MAG: AAA family ATPase [Candidatus Dormibacteraeota bacterium]|uniref:AAA family ATPase n=1 Tax=Candidatus Aeolococcus gillhamiae TaxID=3127015 RepID=A0A934JW09_9BACT|nr:AAA family ATPase [Candidatus Dormibacteraeota bacterium]
MIRNHAIKVSVQATYDAYLQRQVSHYQDYLAGRADATIGGDMEVAEAPTQTTGNREAAAALGLEVGGLPSREAITRVGCGCHAETGVPVTGRDRSQDGQRTAYQDLVFSVPKSVSVEFAAARAAGDEVRAQQLIGVMTDSVEEALEHFQELIPLGRRRVGTEGVQVAVPAKVVALMDVHSAARPVAGQTSGDPQLHVHTRLLNLGLQPGGQVASVNYWMLYQNIRGLNGLFEAGMRTRLEDLGYGTVDASHGDRRRWSSFELERQDEKLSARLSSRQDRIESLVEQEWARRSTELLATLQITAAVQAGMGLPARPVQALSQRQRALCKPTPREVAVLSRASREQKLATTRAELAQEWGTVVDAFGYQHQPAEPPTPGCRSGQRRRQEEMVRIARVALGRDGLVTGRSVFDRGDILEFVGQRAVASRLDESELRRTVARVELKAVRLEATAHQHLGAFTTTEQMGLERAAVAVAVELADEATVSVPEAVVTAALRAEELRSDHAVDAEQAAAVRAFCSPSGWVQLVGVAGSGKTTVCRPAVEALSDAGYQVLGVSLSQGATDVLGAETGIPAWNLADFLTRVEHNQLRSREGEAVSLTPRTVILVDEAGTVDSRAWHGFTQQCQESRIAGVRVLGDPEQGQPVGSGSILGWLSRHLPTTYLATNYRQGEGTLEAEGARLLRDGQGEAFLRLKDSAGQLWIDVDSESSIGRAAEAWAQGIAGGGDPEQHVLLTDLVDVAAQLNRRGRDEYDRMGRLGEERVVVRGREWAVGDRVMFTAPHTVTVPRVDENGAMMLRSDGTPRQQTIRTPRRTQGEVVALARHGADATGAEGPVLWIRTDARGRLPSRVVEVAAEHDILGYGYAMTTTVAQGRTWDTTYRVLTASRLSGKQQEYAGGTRHITQSMLFGDLRSVYAEADGDLSAREDAIAKYGTLISRDLAKVSTLDYLDPQDRSLLVERLAPAYLRAPSLTLKAPMSDRQATYLARLHRSEPGWEARPDWSWVRASVEIDLAVGHPAGDLALSWLRERGVPDLTAWKAVDAACQDATVPNPHPQPAPQIPQHVTPQWDTAAMADAARSARGGKDAVTTSRVPAQPDASPKAPPVEPATGTVARPVRGRKPQPSAGIPLRRPEKKLVELPPEQRPRQPNRSDAPLHQPDRPKPVVKSPAPTDEERRRRDQLNRETTERSQRERGPHAK